MVTVAGVHHGREDGCPKDIGFVELFNQFRGKQQNAFIFSGCPGNTHEHLVETEKDRHLRNNR